MGPNFVDLLESFLFPDEPPQLALADLDALMKAKARQDASYNRLDTWLAATITELSDQNACHGVSDRSPLAPEHEQRFTVPVPKNEWPGNRPTIDAVRSMSR